MDKKMTWKELLKWLKKAQEKDCIEMLVTLQKQVKEGVNKTFPMRVYIRYAMLRRKRELEALQSGKFPQ